MALSSVAISRFLAQFVPNGFLAVGVTKLVTPSDVPPKQRVNPEIKSVIWKPHERNVLLSFIRVNESVLVFWDVTVTKFCV